MAKRSIYFPDELETQMAIHEENWSSVCQDAVASRLKFLELKSDLTSSAVARARARLATDKAGYVADASERGRRAGLAWAADKATFDQLRNLSEADGQYSIDDDHQAAKMVCWAAMDQTDVLDDEPGPEPTEDEVGSFCLDVGVNFRDATSSEFWEGFVEAAIEVYEQV
jgi:hypothetical protein